MARVLSAGIFVFTCVLLWVMVLSWTGWIETLPPVVIAISSIVLFLLLIPAALWMFNRQSLILVGDPEEHRQRLEAAGLLEFSDFEATRSFQVEEAEDEGSHYFMELRDGSVLYMSGQYLYDFEELSDEPGSAQPRRFPCSEFTVVRHRLERYVVDIDCRGQVLAPECIHPPFSRTEWKRVPDDGSIINDVSYEDLRARYAPPTSGGR